jgi:hypothetical protein
MSEEILLKSSTVEITPKVARFRSTSYQIANIGSVSVHVRRKIRVAVKFLIAVAVFVGLFSLSIREAVLDLDPTI